MILLQRNSVRTILLLALSSTNSLGSLGDDSSACNAKYGQLVSSKAYEDVGGQITIERFRGKHFAEVVFNKKGVATEIRFTVSVSSEVEALLKENGEGWKKEKPKLGAAMNARKFERWTTPDGRVAQLEKGTAGLSMISYLTIYTPERLEQLKARGIQEIPVPGL